jgi:hypothetical protein
VLTPPDATTRIFRSLMNGEKHTIFEDPSKAG